ncbi:MAG TPA: FUSC family protein [Candidatus Binataceae bacterium]|nr:FUSC family protein [Candidatus Binataceae bacterium]
MASLEYQQADKTAIRLPVRATAALPAKTHFAFRLAGLPVSSWAFAVRLWIAITIALCTSFWLQLEAPFSAVLTVLILAEPTRGQALAKAGWRLIATIVGTAASLAITGALTQSGDLILAAFAAWLGLCVYASGLLDGYRAYAAVLSGYTVSLIAVQQIDSPQHVFESGMARGAAIAVGVLSITFVNNLLFAPDRYPQLRVQLAAIHRRIREYAKAVIRDEVTDSMATASLMREIVALRPEIASLATETSSGSLRSAAARSTMVALVAELHAVRALAALPVTAGPAFRERLTSMLDRGDDEPSFISPVERAVDSAKNLTDAMATPLAWAVSELLRMDEEVRQALVALKSGMRPSRAWRLPLYRSDRIAMESGLRAFAQVAIASAIFVVAGWPATSVSLSVVALVIGLGSTAPSPREFTTIGLIAAPIAVALAGMFEFLILDGVSDFPLLTIGLAPFVVGAGLLISGPNPGLASLARLSLLFFMEIFAPSNPQTYDPQGFVFASLFVCLGIGLLLAAQFLVPPVSHDRRRRWLITSARHELSLVLSSSDRRYAPEEAMFRDAVRVGQIAAASGTDLQHRISIEEALSYFDQAAAIRLSDAKLTRLADGPIDGPLASLAAEARTALVDRDTLHIRAIARSMREAASGEKRLAIEASGALLLAGAVIAAAPARAAYAPMEKGS